VLQAKARLRQVVYLVRSSLLPAVSDRTRQGIADRSVCSRSSRCSARAKNWRRPAGGWDRWMTMVRVAYPDDGQY